MALSRAGRMLMFDDQHMLVSIGDYGLRWDLMIKGPRRR